MVRFEKKMKRESFLLHWTDLIKIRSDQIRSGSSFHELQIVVSGQHMLDLDNLAGEPRDGMVHFL